MEIYETSERGMTVFVSPNAESFSVEEKEAIQLFSAIATEYNLMSEGGGCESAAAIDPKGGSYQIQKMYVPTSADSRDKIVGEFEKLGHTVKSAST